MSIQSMTDETTLALHAAQATSALYEERCKRLRKQAENHHRRVVAALFQIRGAVTAGDLDESAADYIRKALTTDEARLAEPN